MLNYDTNVEIEFIIISNASYSCLFCLVWVRFGAIYIIYSEFNFTDSISPHILFIIIVKPEHFLEMTLRSQKILFQRPYISEISGRHASVGAITVVPPQFIIEYNVK